MKPSDTIDGIEPHLPLVLVVDDVEDNRIIYGDYLVACGFRVAFAEDGLDAIDAALVELPDLILMDLAMPRLDGLEATKRLRADARTHAIPILAISGHSLKEALQHRRIFDGFLLKPCTPDLVELEIKRLLAR